MPVKVVANRARPSRWPTSRADKMGVVESDQAVAVLTVQSKAVVQSVRPLDTGFYPSHDKADPISSVHVRKEAHSIQGQERIESVVWQICH